MILKWLEKKCYPNHPKVGTAEEWCEWDKVEKSKPICNFIINTVPNWYETEISKRFNDFIYWFKYRLFPQHKYHLINTGLKPNYHEVDTRMFHGMFNLMKEFCEQEQPYHDWCWQTVGEKGKQPKFVGGKQAALKSFEWQKELVYKEDEIWDENKKHLIGTSTPQATNAKELEIIYLWWVDIYPNRVDPYDAVEDPYFDKQMDEDGASMRFLCKRPPEEEEKYKVICKSREELEKQYADEDEEMLIRLIKIRKSLWT